MRIDTRQLQDGSLIEATTLIIGGGIAGMALAKQLADSGREVVILESGAEQPDARTQALYEGKATLEAGETTRDQDAYMHESRFRYFGGSGNRWGGICLPLDPVDFAAREWIPRSGWPITLDQLKPYYNRACDLLDIPHFYTDPGGEPLGPPPVQIDGERTLTSRPLHVTRHTGLIPDGPFQSWKDNTAEHERIRIYFNANVTHIQLAENGTGVDSLRVQTLEGTTHTARATTYVLATGGIENVRLLLASDDVEPSGIGNHGDWLGRCFQGHALIANGLSQLMKLSGPKMTHYTNRSRDRVSWVLATSQRAQQLIQGGNFCLYLREGAPEMTNTDAVFQLASRLGRVPAPAQELMRAIFAIEHTPNRDSRIVLDPDTADELGQPRLRLRWKHSQFDLDSFASAVDQVAQELGRHDIGRLRWTSFQQTADFFLQIGARHHMGTTRMATDPSSGVVDPNGRVHGVGNLFIAGSSVFPTSGLANPTLTILALTLRLGDHLSAGNGGAA